MALDTHAPIVAIGGGHGLSKLLQALQLCQLPFGAIVATTDNGGSTGRLRDDNGGIAWGDLRYCLSALTAPEALGKLLLDYRFEQAGALQGHNLGNLILLALDQLCIHPSDAMKLLSAMLEVSAPLWPMSDHATQLAARFADNAVIVGETQIDQQPQLPQQLLLQPAVPAAPAALALLRQAKAVLIGPGSMLTSLCPPLLLDEVAEIVASKPIGLITNLRAEQSPVTQTEAAAQITLLQQLTGITISASLSHGWPQQDHQQYLYRPLSDDGIEHQPQLLAAALQHLLQKL
ncbi:uridine diphosphate-N-acetylglucosamine-binding protein YvcK [Ferrimonas senticii]|uniref:uridine diphosphate-N-acetylglucosamine-binding protein YvcK n=1 Tax=Ferrimonas senticii TaxID=394566 RepID=UPI00040BC537|nr:uridine diphosphate-N-acetylglucosamine-binding protein YvcK [Ferrimonas senticii]